MIAQDMTRQQIINKATKTYMKGKHPDILVGQNASDSLVGDVVYTDDGAGAWVTAMVWVSLETPPRHRNGRKATQARK